MQKVCQVGKMLGQRHVREEDVAEADIKKEHGARRVEHGWRSIPLVQCLLLSSSIWYNSISSHAGWQSSDI